MTQAPSPIQGNSALARTPSVPMGELAGKPFTAAQERAQRSALRPPSWRPQRMLNGVRQLLRAAMHGSQPRADRALRLARDNLDRACEQLFRALLNHETPWRGASGGSVRVAHALSETIAFERAYAAAGGRIAANHPDLHDVYLPCLERFTFTELLLLRDRLGASVAPAWRPHPAQHGDLLLAHYHRAVKDEIAARQRPFAGVMRVLQRDMPQRAELDAALRRLATALSHRERRGEPPMRLLNDLAGSQGNEALMQALRALASPSLRLRCAPAQRPVRVAISAPDGGAGDCARLVKDTLEDCLRSRLVARAQVAFKQGEATRQPPAKVLDGVLRILTEGVTAMRGAGTPMATYDYGIAMALLARALTEGDIDPMRYLAALDAGSLQTFADHLPALPAARRRELLAAIAQARKTVAPEGASRAVRPSISRTIERVGLQAAPILARVVARLQAELGSQAAQADIPGALHVAAPSRDALTRMSIDVTPRNDGDVEVSVSANLISSAKRGPLSVTYVSRIGPDLRPLRGALRHVRNRG
ncbi:hypothetical protein [Bordetella genomosp. 9]|nr:hypothetical protein [Bordetella genomosp. 9]